MPSSGPPKTDLEKQHMTSSTSNLEPKTKKSIAIPEPSSSILLISPNNQILLLHRTKTSSTYPSAHVFTGGSLDPFHESPIPTPSSPLRHADSPIYRLCAIRECFEECGILLAHAKDSRNAPLPHPSHHTHRDRDGDRNPNPNPNHEENTTQLIHIPSPQKEQARSAIHAKSKNFPAWLSEVGAVPDTQGLIPCTRWITPGNAKRRFTTQMYVYFLPFELDGPESGRPAQTQGEGGKSGHVQTMPKHDGSEHTAAEFADCGVWLERARRGEISLFPPQFYLLGLLGEFLSSSSASSQEELRNQRIALREFLARSIATDDDADGASSTKWADKIISPVILGVQREDGRTILGLGNGAPEFEGEGKDAKGKGDDEQVILLSVLKEGPRDLEVRKRSEVLGGGVKL